MADAPVMPLSAAMKSDLCRLYEVPDRKVDASSIDGRTTRALATRGLVDANSWFVTLTDLGVSTASACVIERSEGVDHVE